MTTEEPENLQIYLPHAEITPESNYRGREIPAGVEYPDCGYDLRGLKRAQPCPECGRPTIRVGSDIHCSDINIEQLQATANGLRMVLIGWMFLFLTPITAIGMSFAYIELLYGIDLGLLFSAWGVWIITNPGVLMKAAGTKQSPRHTFARIFMFTSALAFLVLQSFAHGTTTFTNPFFWFALSFISFFILQILICLECAKLSNTMQDETLGPKFQAIVWLILITGLASMIFFIFAAVGTSNSFVILTVISSFLFLCIEIAFAVLVRSLKKEFIWMIRYQKEREARQ